MKSFGPRAQKCLKIVHIACAGTWLSTAITIALVSWLVSADDHRQVLGIHQTTKFIDDFILIPAANGTWITGLLYSLKTRWGWFRYPWVVVKWTIAVSGIVVGTFVLGPALNTLPETVRLFGSAAFTDPRYQASRSVLLYVGPFQVATLLVACSLSVLKPWTGRGRTAAPRSAIDGSEVAV